MSRSERERVMAWILMAGGVGTVTRQGLRYYATDGDTTYRIATLYEHRIPGVHHESIVLSLIDDPDTKYRLIKKELTW